MLDPRTTHFVFVLRIFVMSKEQYLMAFTSLGIHLLTCELTLMLIGLGILQIDTPLLVIASSLVTY